MTWSRPGPTSVTSSRKQPRALPVSGRRGGASSDPRGYKALRAHAGRSGSGVGIPTGVTGAVTGDWYLNTSNGAVYEMTAPSTWAQRDNLTGPQGVQGPQGDPGPTGPQGPAGPSGEGGGAGHIVDPIEPVGPADGLMWTNPSETPGLPYMAPGYGAGKHSVAVQTLSFSTWTTIALNDGTDPSQCGLRRLLQPGDTGKIHHPGRPGRALHDHVLRRVPLPRFRWPLPPHPPQCGDHQLACPHRRNRQHRGRLARVDTHRTALGRRRHHRLPGWHGVGSGITLDVVAARASINRTGGTP